MATGKHGVPNLGPIVNHPTVRTTTRESHRPKKLKVYRTHGTCHRCGKPIYKTVLKDEYGRKYHGHCLQPGYSLQQRPRPKRLVRVEVSEVEKRPDEKTIVFERKTERRPTKFIVATMTCQKVIRLLPKQVAQLLLQNEFDTLCHNLGL